MAEMPSSDVDLAQQNAALELNEELLGQELHENSVSEMALKEVDEQISARSKVGI